MKILITGHRGFIGGHLWRILEKDHELVGIDLKEGTNICYIDLPDVDKVIHCAAQTDAFCDDALFDATTNVMGTVRLANHYGEKMVHLSSSMVNYDHAPYAISKNAAEKYARLYGCSIVRLCNIYGDGGHSAMDVFKNQKEITIYGDGSQMRTYASITHATDMIQLALHASPGRLFVLQGVLMSVKEIAEATKKPIHYAPARELDIQFAPQL